MNERGGGTAMIPILRACAVCAALASACATPPAPVSAPRPAFTLASYGERIPAEIAVLPIEPVPGFDAADAEVLRHQLYRSLLKKGYTPLAPAFVDKTIAGVTAAEGEPLRATHPVLRSILPTDAYMHVDVRLAERMAGGENESTFYRIASRATLVGGGDGTILYDYTLQLAMDTAFGSDGTLTPAQVESLLGRYVERLIGPLPVRREPLP